MAQSCPQCSGPRAQWDQTCGKCGFDFEAAAKTAAAKAQALAGVACPACGASNPAGEAACAGCGVIFSKWKETQGKKSGQKAAAESAAGEAAAARGELEWKAAGRQRSGSLMAAIYGGMGLYPVKALFTGLYLPTSTAFLADVGVIVVSLLAAACCCGVYMWKRWAVYGFILTVVGGMVIGMDRAESPGMLLVVLLPFLWILKGVFQDWELYQ